MSKSQDAVPSPCVRNCCLNEQDICLGCFRSLEEICGWSQADDQKRKQILANTTQRRMNSSRKKSR
ncbi:MAG: DUF1289 domain-containing protein [Methylomonas sp.]|nr:MAG: DUF1289 domain-containing protein [Methylomonas sp.]